MTFAKPTNQYFMFNRDFPFVEKSPFFSSLYSFWCPFVSLILVFMTVFQQHFQAMFTVFYLKFLLGKVTRHNKRKITKVIFHMRLFYLPLVVSLL